MSRRPDWPERLVDVLDVWQHKPFCWGRGDCVQFAVAIVWSMTERTIELPAYGNRREARAMLGRIPLQTWVSQHLGQAQPVHMAQRGDVVLCAGGLGVCTGAHVWLRAPHTGLVVRPLRAATCCWPL